MSWAGISADSLPPVRRDSLAAPRRAEAIEAAIVEHRRVLLQRYPGVGSFAGSPAGELRVWPLQLIFHNVGWYLLFEEDQVGREQGLIRSERLDRLAMARGDGDLRRSREQHAAAIYGLERLLQRYPIEHTRFSKPLPSDTWWHHPKPPHVLEPRPAGSSQPYPVELDLPPWTVAADIDLRSRLFAFGGGIRIEQPDALRQELVQRCQEAIAANTKA